MGHRLFQVGQKALIERDGKVLVLFFPNGWLDFPGGRIDEGEDDLPAALHREVMEETTLQIEIGAPFASWLSPGRAVFLIAHKCRYISGEVELSDEHTGFRWVDRSDYHELDDGSDPFQALARYFAVEEP